MTQEPARPRIMTAAACSFVCLGLQALWVVICFFIASTPRPDATAEDLVKQLLALLGAMVGVIVGTCLLSAVGVAFGIAGRRSVLGVIALVINAITFLCTIVPLLLLFFTPHGQ